MTAQPRFLVAFAILAYLSPGKFDVGRIVRADEPSPLKKDALALFQEKRINVYFHETRQEKPSGRSRSQGGVGGITRR